MRNDKHTQTPVLQFAILVDSKWQYSKATRVPSKSAETMHAHDMQC